MSTTTSNSRVSAELLDEPPPNAIESEKAFLSAALIAGRLNPDAVIEARHFYLEKHRIIFEAMSTLDGEHGAFDVAMLLPMLKGPGNGQCNWGAYLAELAGKPGMLELMPEHANRIRQAYVRRAVGQEALQILRKSWNGGCDPAALQEHLSRIGQIASGDDTAADKSLRFKRISCAELDGTRYDLEYLIDGLLVAKQPCILAGGKKCLKTSLLIDLGVSLAVGGCFLGKLRVKRPCRVGIMTGESGLATIQETARRIATAAGHQLANIDGLFFSEQLPQFGNVGHEEAVREFITTERLEVLALDPAYMCLPDVDHANLFEVGAQLHGVSQVCQETGAMMLLAHHTKKTLADPFSPPELEDISWAGFQEFARQWLLVSRREIYHPGTGEHRLWLSAGGSAGHSALWALDINEGTRATPGGRFWQVNVMRADEARQQVEHRKEADKEAARQERLQRDKQTVCNSMAKFPKGETKTTIRDASGLHTSRFNPAFSELLAESAVIPCDVFKGNRKKAFEGYKLKADDPQ